MTRKPRPTRDEYRAMITRKVKGTKLQTGDCYVTATGVAEILGYDRVVKGGRVFQVRATNGEIIFALFDGRRTYDVVEPQTQTKEAP